MTYAEIFEPVLYFILNNENKKELLKRLEEEIIESKDKCFQGRISRTINILSGFHDSVNINISDNEQICNIVISLRNKYNDIDKAKPDPKDKIKEELRKELEERKYTSSVINELLLYVEEQ